MTFKERLIQEHPELAENIDYEIEGACPEEFGYEKNSKCVTFCQDCWDREIPDKKESLNSGKTILDRYLESERKRIMEEMCPYDVPWLEREMGEERLMDKRCPIECEKCWGLPLKPEEELDE